MRIALMVEYDGSQYHGWQAQTGLRTVEQELTKALSSVADHEVNIVCAGRTDTGVHATCQIIHFDTESERSIRAFIHGSNSNLPKDISVRWGRLMPEEFHARYAATARRYRYVIANTPIRPALWRRHVSWQYRDLDYRLMHEAGQLLLGEHDFSSFRSTECQSKSPVRNVMSLQVTRKGDMIIIDICANAFLHHMVRNVSGVLMAIGCGKKPVEWASSVLQARDRAMGAETAPPYGLYLVGVTYPEEFEVTGLNAVIPWGN